MKATGLLTRGHVVLPRAALPVQAMTREVLRGLPSGAPGLREWRLFARKTGWDASAGKTLPGYRRVKEFTRALEDHLHGLLPGESFELDVVHLRQTAGLPAYTNHPHFDSSYLTASCALAGPGTALYWRDAAGVHKKGTATGATAVISGQRREAATGLASTIHSAPFGKMKRRIVLVIFFTRTGSSAGLSLRRKLKAEQKFFQDHFDAPDPEVRLA